MLLRCTTIAQLINSSATNVNDSLQLSSGLYSLALSLGREDGPAPADLADFLKTKLVPALESDQNEPSTSNGPSSSREDGKQVLSDVLIDTVWQITQDLDNGLLQHLNSAPTSTAVPDQIDTDTMEVDGGVQSVKSAVDVAKESAAKVAAAQARLATFTAGLIVSTYIIRLNIAQDIC